MEKKQIARIVLYCVLGFVVGLVIGLFWMLGYIDDYTNECIKAYNRCVEACDPYGVNNINYGINLSFNTGGVDAQT